MINTNFYQVSTWKNGNAENAKSTFGIRIKKENYNSLKNWQEIKVGDEKIIRTSNIRFTEKCPEIRNAIIKNFLVQNDLDIWELKKPHKLILYEIEKDKFELRNK